MWYEALFLGALMAFAFIPLYGVTAIPLLAGVGVAGGWLWIGKAQPNRRRRRLAPLLYKLIIALTVLVLAFYTAVWLFPVETQLAVSLLGLGR